MSVSRIDGFTRIGTEEAQQQEASSGSAPLDTGPGATANTAPATGPTAKPPLPVAQVPGAFASLAAVEVVLGGVDLTWDTPGPELVHLRGLTLGAGGRPPRSAALA